MAYCVSTTNKLLGVIYFPRFCTQVGNKWEGGSKIAHFFEGVHPGKSLAQVVRKVDIVIGVI